MNTSDTVITINDPRDPVLFPYAEASEKQLFHYYEPAPGVFLAESPNVILRGLQAGFSPESLLTSAKIWETLPEELKAYYTEVPVYLASEEILAAMPGFQLTRGVQSIMKRGKLPAAESVLTGARRIVVLENVMNPTNVGAIFRSAAALHIDAVLLTGGCADPLQKRALRVSVGTVFQVPWTYLPGEADAVPVTYLQEADFTTVAMALKEDSVSLTDERLKTAEKLAIIMGTEGEGLHPETIAACDYTVMIPMSHGVDSLNVAAASAVAFWELAGRNA